MGKVQETQFPAGGVRGSAPDPAPQRQTRKHSERPQAQDVRLPHPSKNACNPPASQFHLATTTLIITHPSLTPFHPSSSRKEPHP